MFPLPWLNVVSSLATSCLVVLTRNEQPNFQSTLTKGGGGGAGVKYQTCKPGNFQYLDGSKKYFDFKAN